MKKIAILYSKYSSIIDAIKYQLSECEVDCLTNPIDMNKYDLVVLSDYEQKYEGKAVICHHSLLPAFDTQTPVKDAFLSGVKVTGITICYTNPRKIITQYPIFINNDMHYDELVRQLSYIEQMLLPIIVKKILADEPFDVQKIINNGCGGNCGGCSSCNH